MLRQIHLVFLFLLVDSIQSHEPPFGTHRKMYRDLKPPPPPTLNKKFLTLNGTYVLHNITHIFKYSLSFKIYDAQGRSKL